ncbi:MAG: hypothetical protein QGG53_00995, partial [Planctomycetota bacterium]|nr:hypothetical protein [Planctomycetota bacterium]
EEANVALLDEEDEAGDDLEEADAFILQVDLLRREGKTESKLSSRRISFEAGMENPSGEY